MIQISGTFRASKVRIDGVYSEDFGVYLKERPDIPTAEQHVEHIEIRGRVDGELTKKYGFKNVEFFANFHMFDESEGFRKVYRKAKQNLLKAKTLIFDDDSEVYYKVKTVLIDDSPTVLFKYGEIPTTFILDPFQYEISNAPQTITSRTVITNEGYEAQPIITATCSGTGTIYINEMPIIIQNINGTITIDSEMMNAYRKVGALVTNLNSHMIGDFPILRNGNNVIEFDGDISQIELITNKRWL